MVVIPQGTRHNIINKGTTALKLFTVYAPPAEEPGIKHKTKAEAEAAEEGVVSRAVKAVRKKIDDFAPSKSGRKAKAKPA